MPKPAAVAARRPDWIIRTAGTAAGPEPLLDLNRATTQTAEQSTPTASRQRGLSLGMLLSLALHLLPLLLLVQWYSAPVEAPPPIPVQLVLEQPPPPPPPVAPPEPIVKPPPPPPGRLASEEIGAQTEKSSDDPVPLPSEAPAEPDPVPPAKAAPEPELRQVANLVSPEREPTLLAREALALPVPVVEPLPEQPATPVAPVASRQPVPRPRPSHRTAAVEGPPAVRDAYLAHLVTLVRPYLHLLSPEMINGRQGTTSLAIRVLGDGTIARISVSQSSGYPDIDAQVMRIVASVGHFPPLPPWIDQPSWEINFHLRFPFPQPGTARP